MSVATPKRIEFVVDQQGDSTLEAFGFKGKECKEATKTIEEALGLEESSEVKPEYYQTEEHHLHVDEGQ